MWVSAPFKSGSPVERAPRSKGGGEEGGLNNTDIVCPFTAAGQILAHRDVYRELLPRTRTLQAGC